MQAIVENADNLCPFGAVFLSLFNNGCDCGFAGIKSFEQIVVFFFQTDQRFQWVELGGAEAKHVFAAMMDMGKIEIAKIAAACPIHLLVDNLSRVADEADDVVHEENQTGNNTCHLVHDISEVVRETNPAVHDVPQTADAIRHAVHEENRVVNFMHDIGNIPDHLGNLIPHTGNFVRQAADDVCKTENFAKQAVNKRFGLESAISTPKYLPGGGEAKRVFAAMMDLGKSDIAKIEAARCG